MLASVETHSFNIHKFNKKYTQLKNNNISLALSKTSISLIENTGF